jgi:hypothetical protein
MLHNVGVESWFWIEYIATSTVSKAFNSRNDVDFETKLRVWLVPLVTGTSGTSSFGGLGLQDKT